MAACGSSSTSTSSTASAASTPSPSAAPSTPAPTPITAAPTTAPAAGDLSGTWSGQVTGAFSHRFTLTWQQTGSNLSGTIKFDDGLTLNVNGTLQGSTIRFDTVGSDAIAYSGSVSGTSMSGTYADAFGLGGSWSASKTS
jgi:hypothetical protein